MKNMSSLIVSLCIDTSIKNKKQFIYIRGTGQKEYSKIRAKTTKLLSILIYVENRQPCMSHFGLYEVCSWIFSGHFAKALQRSLIITTSKCVCLLCLQPSHPSKTSNRVIYCLHFILCMQVYSSLVSYLLCNASSAMCFY